MAAFDTKLLYPKKYSSIVENSDETEKFKVKINRVNCPKSAWFHWAKHHKNILILLDDVIIDRYFGVDCMLGENSEPFLWRLEGAEVYNDGLSMVMLKGETLMRWKAEIIDRVVEAGFYNYWISRYMHRVKLISGKITIVHPLHEYYNFNLHHTQLAFFPLDSFL